MSKYNNLLTGSNADFMKLITKYSICPPDTIEGYTGKKLRQISADATNPDARLQKRNDNVSLARIENHKKIGYVKLRLMKRGDYKVTGNEGGERIYFDSTYDHNQVAKGYVPVWYLPWNAYGASIRLTIPPAGTGAGPNNDDPDIFFTAAINGCSIFFQGTAQNPTIYHCGGSTGYGNTELDEGAWFWEHIVNDFINFDQGRHKNKGALFGTTVDKRDYVKQTGVTLNNQPVSGFNQPVTQRAKDYYDDLLQSKQKSGIVIKEVSPWGCVLGRRDGNGDWQFYLQENATVLYTGITRKLSKGFQPEVVTQMVSRPLSLKEIFPAGNRQATIRAPIPNVV